MPESLLLPLSLFLLANLLAGLWRLFVGPTPADRLLTSQLFATTAVAILLLQAESAAMPALRDVALVFALLGAVTAIAFVRRASPAREGAE
jgi:multicomponent Na+:H+ antiporter subunit F